MLPGHQVAVTAFAWLPGDRKLVVWGILGVAGGELLIPAIVLLFALDIKTVGSLSLAVSLPTALVAFARYSRDRSFAVLKNNTRFLLTMTAGSIIGAVTGGLLLNVVHHTTLVPALAMLLVLSAAKIWRHPLDPQRGTSHRRSTRTNPLFPGARS